jgi:hypothetical protein
MWCTSSVASSASPREQQHVFCEYADVSIVTSLNYTSSSFLACQLSCRAGTRDMPLAWMQRRLPANLGLCGRSSANALSGRRRTMLLARLWEHAQG